MALPLLGGIASSLGSLFGKAGGSSISGTLNSMAGTSGMLGMLNGSADQAAGAGTEAAGEYAQFTAEKLAADVENAKAMGVLNSATTLISSMAQNNRIQY